VPEVEKLVAGHKGYVARSEVKGDTGSRRLATFTLRVPVESFKALNEGLLALGTAERNAVDSQDVTDEFVDIEARLRNLKKEEDTLNQLLEKSLNREDEIKTRAEIRQIRGEIERIQGRLNYLSKLTTLSTVNLTLREIKDYKPPTAPTFGTRMSDTFGRSWETVVDFAQGLVLALVALVPWAPLWVPALLVGVWGGRRLVRNMRESAAREAAQRAPRPRHPKPVRAEEASSAGEETAIEPVEPPRDEPKPPR
jgi:hypothetical protein